MANRKRNYKAEYAASKRRAMAAGYSSPRQYSQARKMLGIPRRASPIPRRNLARPEYGGLLDALIPTSNRMRLLRKESQNWSDRHSHIARSRYSYSMSDEQVIDYHGAYVERVTGFSRRRNQLEKRRRIFQYLKRWFGIEDEWSQAWKSDLAPA